MADIRASGLAAIQRICKANGATGWGQDDSLAVLQATLEASACPEAERSAILALMRDHKLFNPSQALQRFTAAGLLPERPKRKRGAADLSELTELAG